MFLTIIIIGKQFSIDFFTILTFSLKRAGHFTLDNIFTLLWTIGALEFFNIIISVWKSLFYANYNNNNNNSNNNNNNNNDNNNNNGESNPQLC